MAQHIGKLEVGEAKNMVVFVLNESLTGNMLQCQLCFFWIMMSDIPQKMTKGQGISSPLEKRS